MDENKQNNLEDINSTKSQVDDTSPALEETENKKDDVLIEQKKKKSFLSGNKFKRGGIATIMTVIFIAVVVVLNLLISLLSDRFPSLNVDMTAQKINTLSDQAVEVADKVDKDTTIYLIGKEDAYRNDAIYSEYGLKYSQVANLSERLEEANENIHTEFVDPDTNPEFISRYASDSLTTGKVLVTTEKRHRVLTIDDLFGMTRNQNTGETETYSKADSSLAAALEMVNMDKVPVLTIVTGHGEMLTSNNMGYFLDMMEKQNFEIREIDILTEDIPEDTQLLMIPTPNTDYTDDELDKIRTLLDDKEREEPIAVLAAFHPTQSTLPKLNGFLEEWGISVKSGSMVAESDSSRYASATPSYIMVDHVGKWLEDGNYSRLISPVSVPLELLFTGNGEISADALWTTSEGAYVVTENTTEDEIENPTTGKQTVATVSASIVQFDNDLYYRSVLVFGSSYLFTDAFMETGFDNSSFMSDLMKYVTGVDGSNVSVYTERVQTNVMDITASQNTVMMLGLGVFTIGLPLVILALGLGIFLKRRHL